MLALSSRRFGDSSQGFRAGNRYWIGQKERKRLPVSIFARPEIFHELRLEPDLNSQARFITQH